MMDKFTASNGLTVDGTTGRIVVRDRTVFPKYDLGKYTVEALREFFRAERDAELGRWRWPDNPEWVVYPRRPGFTSCNGADLLVVNEVAGASMEYVRTDDDGTEYVDLDEPAAKAARAYFDAHPEPKPWHDAKPGEVWVVTWLNSASPEEAVIVPHDGWDANWAVSDARRIWPESS